MKTIAHTVLAATLMAAPVHADTLIFVDDPAACAITGPTHEERVFNITDAGFMILQEDGMYAIEYGCEVSPAVPLTGSVGEIHTRVGYCSEPGFIDPGVFTFAAHEADSITVYSSLWETPGTFVPCR